MSGVNYRRTRSSVSRTTSSVNGGSATVGPRDEDRTFPNEFDLSRRWFNLDSSIALGNLHLLVPAQAKAITNPFGDHQTPCWVDGSSHGTNATIL